MLFCSSILDSTRLGMARLLLAEKDEEDADENQLNGHARHAIDTKTLQESE